MQTHDPCVNEIRIVVSFLKVVTLKYYYNFIVIRINWVVKMMYQVFENIQQLDYLVNGY